MEYKLSTTLYSGLEHLAQTVNPFFKTIDFYDPGRKLGINVKTVAAKSNFRFADIYKNIEELSTARGIGVIGAGGYERVLMDVRLDIIIPQGYDEKVLQGVKDAAEAAHIKLDVIRQ